MRHVYGARPVFLAAVLVAILGVIGASVAHAASITFSVANETTVPDGGVANVTLVVNVTGISAAPALTAYWSLRLDSSVFNLTGVTGTAYYVDENNVTHPVNVTVDRSSTGVQLGVSIGSTASSTITLYLTAHIPVLPRVVNTAGVVVSYLFDGRSGSPSSGGTYVTQSGNFTVYIVPEPPRLRVSASPVFLSPGLPVNITVSSSDGSGVASITIRVLRDGSPAGSVTWGSSVTGNATSFTGTYSFTNTSEKGRYTVYVEACDTLGNCANASTGFTVTDTFYIPGNFTTLSQALASPVVADGVALVVTGTVHENNTVNVYKRVYIVGGSPDAEVVFDNTGYGFNLTAGGATVANLSISGASTAFLLCSNGNTIENVAATATRYVEPCSTTYLDNTVTGGLLNGSKVLYRYRAEASVTGSYAEAHLYNGNYTVANADIGYMETSQSTVEIRGSTIGSLVDLGGSRIEAYDSSVASYRGAAGSSYTGYRSLAVTVLYGGEPLAGAAVRVTGALLAAPLTGTTGTDGTVSFTVPVERGTTAITASNTVVTVEASYMGLRNTTTVDLAVAGTATVELPSPSLAAAVTDIFGNPVAVLKPGHLVVVNATYDLLTYSGQANLTVQLLRNGVVIETTTIPLSQPSGSYVAMIMVPWQSGSYKIVVKLSLEGLPALEKTLP